MRWQFRLCPFLNPGLRSLPNEGQNTTHSILGYQLGGGKKPNQNTHTHTHKYRKQIFVCFDVHDHHQYIIHLQNNACKILNLYL